MTSTRRVPIRRGGHMCPTPIQGAIIGDLWRCDCRRWWYVARVDASDHGAWTQVRPVDVLRRNTIRAALERNPSERFIPAPRPPRP